MVSLKVPVLTQRQTAKSLKGKTSKPVKNVLCTPYKVIWPAVDGSIQDEILCALKKSFSERNLRNPLTHNMLYRRLKKDERRSKKSEYLEQSEQTPEELNLRSQLVFGVTEITRALEKGTLRLVVVDRSSPWQLHRHLAQLSAVRGCPAVAVDRVSDTLSSLVSVTRMCALGLRAKRDGDSNYLDTVVDSIIAKCPPVELPWLECDSALQLVKSVAMETEQLEDEEKLEQKRGKIISDYSHLYVKRSSISELKSGGKVCGRDWKFENTSVFDDMWGRLKKKLPSAQPNESMPKNCNADKHLLEESQDISKTAKESKKSKKRMYCELNIEEVVKVKQKKK